MTQEQLTTDIEIAIKAVNRMQYSLSFNKEQWDYSELSHNIFILKLAVDNLHSLSLLKRREQKSKIRRYTLDNQRRSKIITKKKQNENSKGGV